MTHRLASPFIDFLYPPVCIACNTLLHDGTQKICSTCWNSIPRVTQEHVLFQETRAKLCSDHVIDNLVTCYIFEKEGPFQQIAHALKYQEYRSLGIMLGQQIGNTMRTWNIGADIIIPVPLHRLKQRERGYNQSELIAHGIASVLGKPVMTNLIYRVRHTQTQTKLNLEERHQNMENAFALAHDAIRYFRGKHCLLVDDVITTGATTNSCAKNIHTAGTASIIAASAAIAQ